MDKESRLWLAEFLGDEVVELELVKDRDWTPEEVTGYNPRNTVLGKDRRVT